MDFCESYLKNRFQRVLSNGVISEELEIKQGVPQGSILGPLMFILYVNDMPNLFSNLDKTELPNGIPCFRNRLGSNFVISQYADDTSALVSCENNELLETEVNLISVELNNWCKTNGLQNNSNKQEIVRFKLGDRLDAVRHAKLLGVTIDSGLKWHEHTVTLSLRLNSLNFLFYKLRDKVSQDILITTYKQLFISVASYCIRFWGGATIAEVVLKKQKRCLRIILKKGFREHCKPLFLEHQLLTIPAVYAFEQIKFVRTNLHHFRLVKDVHCYNTRNAGSIHLPQVRTTTAMNAPDSIAIKMYNHIPACLKELPVGAFLGKIKLKLLQNPIYNKSEFFNIDFTT